MAVQMPAPARAAWLTLAPGDFAAVDDLVSDLAERHVHGEAIEVAGSVDVGHYLVDVVAVRSVVAMLTRTPSDIIVLAVGRT